jgi:hypothetical protein
VITSLQIESFKSLHKTIVPLGQISVFIGPNGGGKSNLLEALGVLSAAAGGRVNDAALLARGVRTGLPNLYKSAFPKLSNEKTQPQHIFLGVEQEVEKIKIGYEVTLNNPLKAPEPDWRFKHEKWYDGTKVIASRSPRSNPSLNPALGLAALRAVEQSELSAASRLLEALRGYVIYTPTTPVLRGIAQETQPIHPLGLSGGRIPEAVQEFLRQRGSEQDSEDQLGEQQRHTRRVAREALGLIDWAEFYGAAPSSQMALSPAAAASSRVVRFRDRYMLQGRNFLSGYDASEGALYVLFLAVLAAHADTPRLFAVDNADHGLNPGLLRALMQKFCRWILDAPQERQVLLTTHNPMVLDGLPLQDERVRLFTVSRSSDGRSQVQRVLIDDRVRSMAQQGWTLSRLWTNGYLGGMPHGL